MEYLAESRENESVRECINYRYLPGDSDRQAGVTGQNLRGVISVYLQGIAPRERHMEPSDPLAAEPTEGPQAPPVTRQH
jgi:hypothetical protein